MSQPSNSWTLNKLLLTFDILVFSFLVALPTLIVLALQQFVYYNEAEAIIQFQKGNKGQNTKSYEAKYYEREIGLIWYQPTTLTLTFVIRHSNFLPAAFVFYSHHHLMRQHIVTGKQIGRAHV